MKRDETLKLDKKIPKTMADNPSRRDSVRSESEVIAKTGSKAIITLEEHYADLLSFIEKDLDPSKRLSKSSTAALTQKVTELAFEQVSIKGENNYLREEVEKLRGKVQTLMDQIKKPQSTSGTVAPMQMSFAEALGSKKKNSLKQAIQKVSSVPKMTLSITSKTGEDAKSIQDAFTKATDPTKDGIKVRGMRAAGKVLIVETNTKKDAQKIVNKEVEKTLKCEPPRRDVPL